MSVQMTWDQSERIRLRYVCSDCWTEVRPEKVEEDVYLLRCQTADCTTPGIVSLRTVKYKKSVNEHQLHLARIALHDSIPWMHIEKSNKSVEQLMKELGY